MKMKKVFALLLTCGLALPFMAHAGHHGGERCEGMSKRMEQRLDALQTQLKLDPAQQAQFAKARQLSLDAMKQGRETHSKLHEQAKAELAKPRPDLAALAEARDKAEEATRSQRQAARKEWLALYATLSPEQVAVAKAEMGDMLGRFERGGHRHGFMGGRG
ncbi:MAG: Spy/CpxP family protein refolding chaperone [Zoogloea sp.]|uniref:Spy/CpxP family protein refolding chaperone n=1 Tax=Zoogloea sp. TaxID=49181 RepID=UPI003F359992|nr:periplasmic heavy metal sensor [Rhodocyclales bacterium]